MNIDGCLLINKILYINRLEIMEAPKRGRPKKAETEGTEKQRKGREYMRKYNSEIKAGITQLEKDEITCLEELDKIRKERKKLIEELEKTNNQAGAILKEKVGKKS